MTTLEWATCRMLKALDIYWLGYEGGWPLRNQSYFERHGIGFEERWWHRYEKYRLVVERELASGDDRVERLELELEEARSTEARNALACHACGAYYAQDTQELARLRAEREKT